MKNEPKEHVIRPYGTAALLAVTYGIASVVYIEVSSHFAAASSPSVEHLERLEIVKGVVFVLGTGVLFFVVSLFLLERMRRQQELLAASRDTLIASEHRALAGLFAASVAHDINNLLTVARGNAEMLALPGTGTETRVRASDAMQRAFVELSALSQRLVTLGRESGSGVRGERDLVAAVERAVQLARRHERVRRCMVAMKAGKAVMMPLDEVLIDRMILNLILNAADATGGIGRIEVRVTSDADAAYIDVHDDGPGIRDDSKDAIFEAFYTSKPNGLGLGLVSVKVCAKAHGGSVTVDRSDLGGAHFRVRLPRYQEEA
jgi:two-component system sensor histidine kinase HydH